jgi:restriction system protein
MIPNYQECMLPLLQLLGDQNIHTLRECIDILSKKLQLSEDEKSELLPSGKQTIIANRTSWAKFYLEKAGLVENVSRGKYRITPNGLNLLNENPSLINNDVLLRYEQFRSFIKNSSNKEITQEETTYKLQPSLNKQTPEEVLDTTYKQLQSNLSEELLEKVLQQSPQFFERLVVDLLVKMGYGAGKITGRTGDGGIDGIIDEDKLGLDIIHIQAKRWQIGNNVGRRELQSFVGALAGQSGRKGVFITTSSFTREALEYNPSNVKIAKIDGKRLADLMITYNLGVSTKVLYEIKKLDTDYFDE